MGDNIDEHGNISPAVLRFPGPSVGFQCVFNLPKKSWMILSRNGSEAKVDRWLERHPEDEFAKKDGRGRQERAEKRAKDEERKENHSGLI
jgi:hypothetical protein